MKLYLVKFENVTYQSTHCVAFLVDLDKEIHIGEEVKTRMHLTEMPKILQFSMNDVSTNPLIDCVSMKLLSLRYGMES